MPEPPQDSIAAAADRCLAEAAALKHGDYQRLLSVAEMAANYAQTLGDFRRYGQALNHQAWGYVRLGKFEASLTFALESLTLARDYDFLDIEARSVNILAMNFLFCGINHEAKQLYNYQLELGRRLGDNQFQAMALHDLALAELFEEAHDPAIEYLQEALKLMPSDGANGMDYSIIQGNLALAYIEAHRLEDALKEAQGALSLAQAVGTPMLIGDRHHIVGMIYDRLGDLPNAYAHAEKARSYLQPDTPAEVVANVEMLYAGLFAREGRDAEAIAGWERAYEIVFEQQLVESCHIALNHLKAAYERINDREGLLRTYKRLAEDVPRLKKRGRDLRFTVLQIVFTRDKTALYQLQAESRLNNQKKAILDRLSHEFRTPLAVIHSAAETVEKYGDRLTLDQRQKRLRRIQEQVQRMTVMLEDIVELLKLDEESYVAPPFLPFQLQDLAQQALLGIERYRLGHPRVQVRLQADVGSIHGPQKSLETVLIHLLTNAVKFSKDEVILDLSVEGDRLVIRVQDKGIGVPLADQSYIFEPLVRGSNLDEVTGAGMGLTIVAKLVEQMHGTITFQSIVNEGTSVIVRVPIG